MNVYCPHNSVPKTFNPADLLEKMTCRACGKVLTEQEKADRLGLNDRKWKPSANDLDEDDDAAY